VSTEPYGAAQRERLARAAGGLGGVGQEEALALPVDRDERRSLVDVVAAALLRRRAAAAEHG